MNINRLIIVGLAFVLTVQLKAQVKEWFSFQNRHNDPQLTVGIDSRNTFVGSNLTQMLGAQLNWKKGSNWSYGISFYTNSIQNKQAFELDHVGLQSAILLFKSSAWEFKMSGLLAFGSMNWKEEGKDASAYVAYENLAAVKRNILKYFYLSGGIGYRVGLFNPAYKDLHLTRPLYQLGFGLNVDKIFSDIKAKHG